jgi:hypothetical protein
MTSNLETSSAANSATEIQAMLKSSQNRGQKITENKRTNEKANKGRKSCGQ